MTSRPHPPSTTGSPTVVIGAGAVGATIAYELARRGVTVTLIDEGDDVGHGCSYANAGLLAPAHVETLATPATIQEGLRHVGEPTSPLKVTPRPTLLPWLARLAWSAAPARSRAVSARLRELARASLALHLAYAAQGVDTGVRRSGSLDLFLTRQGWQVKTGGRTAGVYFGDRARALEPSVTRAYAAVPHEEDAHCDSRVYTQAMVEAACREGAQVRWGCRVRHLSQDGDRITRVVTADRQGRTEEHTVSGVMLAAGMGSPRLGADVGLYLPLRGARGYVVDLEPVPGLELSRPVTLKERRVVATPYQDRLRLCGTLELGADDRPLDRRRLQAIRAAGVEALGRAASGRVLQVWAGLRPTTCDGAPIIGRSGALANLYVATGHGMWGLVLAPVTARMLAEGIVEGRPTLHEATFSPDRFAPFRGGAVRGGVLPRRRVGHPVG
ncbi:D-amino-acid dehydrogenase [Austwickia chelonae]|uniref:NAD(P)/FAD-dependent oxidoreductase n=1 Tax=Austwickia chelonae TaxID=100225 RepID=UPI000691CE3D|nr:FAD-dependent oxidoreductase [Austwickia chelonae]SEV84966.1 D-amino-acid dehydrogenase [Austwickia chelonae]